ncbi:hypothetical protein HGM15179_014299 [Zosterops borbonicus]|uniref:C2 domain-containing protein n=1 Tax=Zosterops borbonicus TaxID=364589 RepID=A0A8K1G6W3_9PASS|nr:hypothetical protein HGM15179_014299 [Zosterops borbonicus]
MASIATTARCVLFQRSMAVVIRLQGLPIVAGTMDIRHFFSGLTIPDGGVHIVGGELDGRMRVPGGAVRVLPEPPRQGPGLQVGPPLRPAAGAGGSRWAELDCMEKIKNCQDPEFCKKLVVDYDFEKVHKLKFSMYDIGNKSFDLNDDDYLGEIECTVGQISAELIKNTRVVYLETEAQNLNKKDFLGKSNPFLEFDKQSDAGTWQLAYRSEVIKNNLNR